MKLLTTRCIYSGAELQISAASLPKSLRLLHPIFTLSNPEFYRELSTAKFTPESGYIFALSLGHRLDLIQISPRWFKQSEIALHQLEPIIYKFLNLVPDILAAHGKLDLPCWKLSEPEQIYNLSDYLDILQDSLIGWKKAYIPVLDTSASARRLAKVEKILRQQSLNKSSPNYRKVIAEWAGLAAHFNSLPKIESEYPLGRMSLSAYWTKIICLDPASPKLTSIPPEDVIELREYLEDNLILGTPNSHDLLEIIRELEDELRDQFGFTPRVKTRSGDHDFEVQTITIAECTEEPKPEQFASKIDYLLAKAKWDMK